jgi:hypothetical protein
MKLAVSHDEEGNITTLFDPDKLDGGNCTFKYVPASGEKHHVLEVPKEFERKPFEELPKLLRVNANGGLPQLERRS